MIEDFTEADIPWVRELLKKNPTLLHDPGQVIWRFFNQRQSGEFWMVIRPHALAHFKVRRDGWKTLYEIAVDATQRRNGYARKLVEHIGRPLQLKTDEDNVESNAFYKALGFLPMGLVVSSKGKRINVYKLF